MKLVVNEDKKHKVIINIVVLCVAIYSFTKRNTIVDEISPIEDILMDSLAPLQESVSAVNKRVVSFFDNYVANINASKQNEDLKGSISELELKIYELNQLEKENHRLKELMSLDKEQKWTKVYAQIVAWDANSDYKVIRINKGIKAGLRLQSAVITAQGLVGYVYRLSDHYADVLTILDSSMRVDAMIDRTRSHGIIEGYSSDTCLMKYVTRTETVTLGDVVITSGFGNVFPKGIRVGEVIKIERETYGITQFLLLEPSVDFNELEEVIVLIQNISEDLKAQWQALDLEYSEGVK
jgi:rod shape-determining protein MreC